MMNVKKSWAKLVGQKKPSKIQVEAQTVEVQQIEAPLVDAHRKQLYSRQQQQLYSMQQQLQQLQHLIEAPLIEEPLVDAHLKQLYSRQQQQLYSMQQQQLYSMMQQLQHLIEAPLIKEPLVDAHLKQLYIMQQQELQRLQRLLQRLQHLIEEPLVDAPQVDAHLKQLYHVQLRQLYSMRQLLEEPLVDAHLKQLYSRLQQLLQHLQQLLQLLQHLQQLIEAPLIEAPLITAPLIEAPLKHRAEAQQQPVEAQQQPVEAQQHVEAQEEARSIFLAGTYHPANPKFVAVVKYDLNKLTKEVLPEFECVARFTPRDEHNRDVKLNKLYNRIVWKACVHSSISNSTSTTLCLLPVYLCKTKNASDASGIEEDAPLAAYIYDIKTAKILKKFKAPEASKLSGLVFCLEDMIYCIAYPSWTNIKPSPSFQRYDLKNERTSDLASFPWDDDSNEKILGYAVFQDFVLFNVYPTGLWGYFVEGNKWYEVSFDNQPPSFQGVGIVLEENTLYALKESRDDSILLRLHVEMKKGSGDPVEFTASLEQKFILPDRYYSHYKTRDWDKDVLVHLGDLGEHKFCLVRNGLIGKGYNLQLLQLVMFTVKNEEMIVSVILEHQVEICEYSPFKPILGFSLPASHSKQFKDKQKNGLGSNITLDPFFSSEEIQEAVQ